jgi:hypothetical protein
MGKIPNTTRNGIFCAVPVVTLFTAGKNRAKWAPNGLQTHGLGILGDPRRINKLC